MQTVDYFGLRGEQIIGIRPSLRHLLFRTVPYASSPDGPRCYDIWLCTECHAGTASQSSSFCKLSAKCRTFSYGSLLKHCQTLRRHFGSKQVAHAQEQLQVDGGEFQRQAHLFHARSLGRRRRLNPAFHTWGSAGTERLHLGIGIMPLPSIGPSKVKHDQRQPHTLDHLPRSSSPGHHCSLARCMHMQATQHDGGPQSASC